jgi:hypothetical protein
MTEQTSRNLQPAFLNVRRHIAACPAVIPPCSGKHCCVPGGHFSVVHRTLLRAWRTLRQARTDIAACSADIAPGSHGHCRVFGRRSSMVRRTLLRVRRTLKNARRTFNKWSPNTQQGSRSIHESRRAAFCGRQLSRQDSPKAQLRRARVPEDTLSRRGRASRRRTDRSRRHRGWPRTITMDRMIRSLGTGMVCFLMRETLPRFPCNSTKHPASCSR